jgi:hypothetical protein
MGRSEKDGPSAFSTGLVADFTHVSLPQIAPGVTFFLTIAFMAVRGGRAATLWARAEGRPRVCSRRCGTCGRTHTA